MHRTRNMYIHSITYMKCELLNYRDFFIRDWILSELHICMVH